jgi:hypothetical protein
MYPKKDVKVIIKDIEEKPSEKKESQGALKKEPEKQVNENEKI